MDNCIRAGKRSAKSHVRYLKYIILLSVLIPALSFSQQHNDPEESKIQHFTEKVQKIYGVDDRLINGYPYQAPGSVIASHPYFLTEDWLSGTVFMSGEAYHNKQIKYDLEKDAIVLKATLQDRISKIIHLNSFLIDSVRINNHLFIHSRKYFPADSVETFYEEVYKTTGKSVGLLIHYSKTYLSQYTNVAPRGRFSDMEADRWFIRQGNATKVNRRRAFLKQFDQKDRQEIRRFMRNQDISYRRATAQQLQQLMKFCSGKITEN